MSRRLIALWTVLMLATTLAKAEDRILIPGVARVSGFNGTSWRTSLVILNPHTVETTVVVEFLERGRSNPEPDAVSLTVPPHGSLLVNDVVGTLFELDETAGSLVLHPDGIVIASARTWTMAGSGTAGYGQFVSGVEVRHRDGVYQSLLPQLTDTSSFRTNFGIVNLGYDQLEAWVAPVVFDGENPKPRLERIPAWGAEDFSGRLAEPGGSVADAFILIEADFLPGPYFAWASVVDNGTGDAVFIPPVLPSGGEVIIPAAAHLEGVGGALWRTDLEVVGDPFLPVSYRLEWWPSGGLETELPSPTVDLAPGEARRHSDVVAGAFGADGSGAIRVVFTEGQGLVSSRTFVVTPAGTYGQFIPRLTDADLVSDGAVAWLAHLRGRGAWSTGYRTNLGVVNPDDATLAVEVQFFNGGGDALETVQLQVPALGLLQINGVLRKLGLDHLDLASARVRCLTPDARFAVWASVVDNGTDDPIFIPGVGVPDPPGE